MSTLSMNRVKFQLNFPLSPPLATTPGQLNLLIFRTRKILRPFSGSLILRNIVAESNSRVNVSVRIDCDESGGANEAVSSKYAEIIIVRHGETEGNSDHRIQGHLDLDLNDVGRQQAIAVADRLSKEPKISAVYSSDLKRAFDTAEMIAKGCGVHEVTKEPDLRERNFGALEGLIYDQISTIDTLAYNVIVSKGDDEEIPGGGESFQQLYDRCTSALLRIAKKHQGERVVVVTHGGAIRALHRRASPHSKSGFNVMNSSLSVFHVSDDDKWSIKVWDDVSHLGQTLFLESGHGGDGNSG